MTGGPTLARVMHAELLKVVSLRSSLAAYVAFGLLLAPVFAVELTLPSSTGGTRDAALVGVLLLELLVGVTAVAASAGEYTSGTARSTFAAVPARWPVLVAKVVVHVGLVVGLAVPALALGVVGALAADSSVIGPLDDPEVVRAVSGTVLTLAGVSALGIALGMLTRSIAVGASAFFVVMFLPAVVVVAPAVTAWLPARLAQTIVLADLPAEGHFAAAGPAVAAYAGWAVALLLLAGALLRRRDV